jgi:tRNA(Ile)-lysidine synthetase-like protein
VRRRCDATPSRDNDLVHVVERVEELIREQELIPPGGDVTCLVSGGADSTCLWHVLQTLGYAVSSLHVNHGVRPDADSVAAFCADEFGAEVAEAPAGTEAEMREARYSLATDRLRATGHTASDQVETILYRFVTSGTTRGIHVKRDDGVVRPLLVLWRDETRTYCERKGLRYVDDPTNADTVRGLIRDQVLPLLRRIHPAADENILRGLRERAELPPALGELLASTAGSKRLDLGDGVQVVREYDRVWWERSPVALEGEVRWGPWRIRARDPGLKVRAWRAGDRLAGRTKKIQDVFVDAKIPRSERDSWPLVVRGNQVVAVPGILEAEGIEATRDDEGGLSGSSGVAGGAGPEGTV